MANVIAPTSPTQNSYSESSNLFHQKKPNNFSQNISVAQRGGKVAGDARKAIEAGIGKSVITSKNANQLNHVVTQMIETSSNVTERIPTNESSNN